MKIAFTGHTNIEKANGKEIAQNGTLYNPEILKQVVDEITFTLFNWCKEKGINFYELEIISGMARGVDEVVALMAIQHNLKLILAIPNSVSWHKNRAPSRDVRAQAIYYDYILEYNKLEINQIKKDYGTGHPFANFARNQFMVDIADKVFSYKKYNSTGTDHCIKAAKKKGNYQGNIPELLKYYRG